MANNSQPMPVERRGLDMNIPESQQAVENPQNNEEVYLASFNSILAENIGAYVVVEFLIGTDNLVSKEGILYNAGNNFITIYNDVDNYYTVCDLYSVKFVNFFDPRYLRRRTDNEIASLSFERDGSLPIYYTSVAPGETPQPPQPPQGSGMTATGGPAPRGPRYPFGFR